jgi:hypothetical protein
MEEKVREKEREESAKEMRRMKRVESFGLVPVYRVKSPLVCKAKKPEIEAEDMAKEPNGFERTFRRSAVC